MRPWPFLLLLPLAAPLALADDDEHDDDEPERLPTATDPAYAAECGSCHYAYPPGLLPARSWTAIMADLPNHFGDDATLAEPTRTQLQAWLIANAAPTRSDAAPLRITETSWWRHEHDEIPKAWVNPADGRRPATAMRPDAASGQQAATAGSGQGDPEIRSFANCPACHTGADRGSFREGEIRIPGHGRWDD